MKFEKDLKTVYNRFIAGGGAHSSRFRSRFSENMDFEVFTSTYAEFHADHEYDLIFWIWGFCKS